MYQHFIGIDIGKFEVYVAIHVIKKVETFSNDKAGFTKFHEAYKSQLVNGLVLLETTGGYENKLIEYLQKSHIALHRANTRIVKSFIRSIGKLGKSDSIDALGLARYGFERHKNLPLYQAPNLEDKKLAQLTNRKKDLQKILVQEKNRLKGPDSDLLKDNIQKHIEYIENEITTIKEDIQALIKANKIMTNKAKILKEEIAGIGEITASDLLVLLPELGTLNNKQIASLAGVAPHPNESSKTIGYRKTRGGRDTIKPTLYMAAMAASRSNSQLGEFYKSLIARGKRPMVALTALMRKIIVQANAKIRDFNTKQNSSTTLVTGA